MDKVTSKDIENKLREIKDEVDSSVGAVKPAVITIGSVIATAALGIAFIAGERKSKKRATVVEIRRV